MPSGELTASGNFALVTGPARAGEDVIITRHGKPDVRLAPVAAPARRQLGFLKVPPLPDGFDAPLAPDELALWE